MKSAFVIFNGIQFPYYLADHAIAWAAKNEASLQALFIHSVKEPPEGYIFPSDIDPAEDLYGKEDAEKSNVNVIRSQVKLFTDMAAGKNVSASAEELIDPSINEIETITAKGDVVFVDAAFDKAFLLASAGFRLKQLKASKCPLEIIEEKK